MPGPSVDVVVELVGAAEVAAADVPDPTADVLDEDEERAASNVTPPLKLLPLAPAAMTSRG